jgi:hypothetical protein
VVAGVIAQLTADFVGEIGPFHLAVFVTVVATVLVHGWPENYGGKDHQKVSEEATFGTQTHTWTRIRKDIRISSLGLCYSLFEGAMYVFGKYFIGFFFPTGLMVFSNLMIFFVVVAFVQSFSLVSNPSSDCSGSNSSKWTCVLFLHALHCHWWEIV